MFARTPASPPCSCPFRLSPSGKTVDPEAPLPASPVCDRDSTPRFHGARFLTVWHIKAAPPCAPLFLSLVALFLFRRGQEMLQLGEVIGVLGYLQQVRAQPLRRSPEPAFDH